MFNDTNLKNFAGLTGEKNQIGTGYDGKVNLEFLAEIIKLQGQERSQWRS